MNTPEHEPKVLYRGRYLHLVERNGWEFAHRPKISGIVGIVAVTDDGKLLLVEQYRPPVDGPVIELPAGLAGDTDAFAGEDLATAARRELLEETGYEAGRMVESVRGTASSGMSSEIMTLFVAQQLRKTGEGRGDQTENITVHEAPLEDIHAWLRAQEARGAIVDLKVYAGLALIQRLNEGATA